MSKNYKNPQLKTLETNSRNKCCLRPQISVDIEVSNFSIMTIAKCMGNNFELIDTNDK